MLKIIPLGGLGEIGLNMMVVEYGDTGFIIDAGLMFPEDYMLGIDIVIPVMDYIKQSDSHIAGIFLTMPMKIISELFLIFYEKFIFLSMVRLLHWEL